MMPNDSRDDSAERGGRRAPLRVGVLASGGGSNLQALLDRFNASGAVSARVEVVVGSRAGIGALERAAAAGVAARVVDPRTTAGQHAPLLLELLEEAGVDLVVLAGYMHLVPAAVVERYRGRMINIHPALLPSFGGRGLYGLRVHRAALDAGVRVSGATVHLVDERYDTGPIVAQWPVPVLPTDTPETLAARVLRVEHRLLPAVVAEFADGGDASRRSAEHSAFSLEQHGGPEESDIRSLIRLPRSAATDAPTPDF